MEVDQEKVRLEAEAEELAEAEMTPEVEARLVSEAGLLRVMIICQLVSGCAVLSLARVQGMQQMWLLQQLRTAGWCAVFMCRCHNDSLVFEVSASE
jgi:hypothetical protein